MRRVPFMYIDVSTCAEVLRMNPHTIYRAIQRDEIPHTWVANQLKIPVSFLGLQGPEIRAGSQSNVSKVGDTRYGEQLGLFWMAPVRVHRNETRTTMAKIKPWTYERMLWRLDSAPEPRRPA